MNYADIHARAAFSQPAAVETARAVDAYPALHSLTEAVLTRADPDYMRRCLAAAVRVMESRGWTPPVPFPATPPLPAQPSVLQAGDALPPLPEPIATFEGRRRTPEGTQEFWGLLKGDFMSDPVKQSPIFTAEQMQDYARAALAAASQSAEGAPVDRDAARYRYIVDHNIILSGGGWPVAPFGRKDCDKYIDAARASLDGVQGEKP